MGPKLSPHITQSAFWGPNPHLSLDIQIAGEEVFGPQKSYHKHLVRKYLDAYLVAHGS